MARLALLGVVLPGHLGNPPEVRLGGTANGRPVELAVRECDEPGARAGAARL